MGFLSADSGQPSLQKWYNGALGKQNQKFPAWFGSLPTTYFTTLLSQAHVMLHTAMQYMKITLSSALQNIFQIDAHLWRNLLFLDRSWKYCTQNISDVPDMATVGDEVLFTTGMLETPLSSSGGRQWHWWNASRCIHSSLGKSFSINGAPKSMKI